MTENKEIRAKALEIAALIWGQVKEPKSTEEDFKLYKARSLIIERYIHQADPPARNDMPIGFT